MTEAELKSEQRDNAIEVQTEALYQERLAINYRRTDRVFGYLMLGQWVFALILAIWVSPYAWAGRTRVIHAHVLLALGLGGAITFLPFLLSRVRPGWVVTRNVIAAAQMLWGALLIHLTGGRIETHFFLFGSLAFLAFYRDWKVLIPATVVVAADHLLRQAFWPESVYGVTDPVWWRFLEHAGWVVFEDVFLVFSCVVAANDVHAGAAQQVRIEVTERLEKEMEIAAHLQTSILPPAFFMEGLEISARMVPATEVGGDYYDVIRATDGCWIGIGDVAGHGLEAGLMMLQAQSAVGALISSNPDASPRVVLEHINSVLYQNIRKRLRRNEHMTFSMIRYHSDGTVVIAGAHEEFLICRAATGAVERVPVKGTWLGVVEHVLAATVETTVQLQEGDLLILYTDGVTEARNAAGEQYGLDQLTKVVTEQRGATVDQIRDRVFDHHGKWMKVQDDDVTLLVLRHIGRAQKAAA